MTTRTILVAEDNHDDACLLRHAFKKTGLDLSLRFVTNGQEAIDYIEGKCSVAEGIGSPEPDLLLTDLKMPCVDGFELLGWLQRHPQPRGFPAVVLSSSNIPSDIESARQLGAVDYCEKMSDLAQLARKLREVCNRWIGCA